MVDETADPVLLSSRAGGRWLTAGAFVLAAALLATQSFDLKRSAAPKPDFAMEFRIAETVKPAPAPTPEVKKSARGEAGPQGSARHGCASREAGGSETSGDRVAHRRKPGDC